jgi:hypothetical protein
MYYLFAPHSSSSSAIVVDSPSQRDLGPFLFPLEDYAFMYRVCPAADTYI